MVHCFPSVSRTLPSRLALLAASAAGVSVAAPRAWADAQLARSGGLLGGSIDYVLSGDAGEQRFNAAGGVSVESDDAGRGAPWSSFWPGLAW